MSQIDDELWQEVIRLQDQLRRVNARLAELENVKMERKTAKGALRVISETHGVGMDELFSANRTRRVSRARWHAFDLLRSDMHWSFPRIAQFFGVDHTTVLHGISRLREMEKTK